MEDALNEPPTGAALISMFMARAEHHRSADEPKLAEEALRSALMIAPHDGVLHLSLSMALAAAGDQAQAAGEAEAAARLAPEIPECWLWLGLVEMERAAHQAAEHHLLNALRLDPNLAFGYHLYALLMYRTGHLGKAEALLGEALRREPAFAEAHATLAMVLAERRRKLASLVAGQTSVLVGPGRDGSHAALGIVCLEAGQPFRARAHFAEALRLEPGREHFVALFQEADRACRWIYWPMYQWTRLVQSVPGQQFGVWAAVIALYLALSAAGAPRWALGGVLIPYAILVIYTWLALPLAKAWIKLRPPG